jgi:hypothetical protein
MTRTAIVIAAGLALAATLSALPVQAQTRDFVGITGSDSNPCTNVAPCRSFQHAHDTVAANGEIDVLDPGGYGTLTINKAISIQGHGFSGISVVSGTGNAITINADSSDTINLRGLLIDGAGTGLNAIVFNSGASLNIQDCAIRNLQGSGISFIPSNSSQLFVSETIVSDNAGIGTAIVIFPSTSVAVTGFLNHVELDNYYNGAIAGGSQTYVAIRSSFINGNGQGGGGGGSGVAATGGAALRLSNSTLIGNSVGWNVISGTISSTGDNFINDNGSDSGTLSSLAYK